MKINIIKPDHLGDLVLSSPSIRVLLEKFPHATLWVAPESIPLARYLFGGDHEVCPVVFPHLSKVNHSDRSSIGTLTRVLESSDVNVFLRRDGPILELATGIRSQSILIQDDNMCHQSLLDRNALLPLTGDYSRTKHFFKKAQRFPSAGRLERVGLVPGAGFTTNTWPESYWARFASLLLQLGIDVCLIGAEDVLPRLRLISDALGGHIAIVHCDNTFDWLNDVGEMDLVVAVDGGTAHLCSLVAPVMSIFGPSPWRRYAPFGACNVLLTRNAFCAPCQQFTSYSVNGCLYRHCLLEILPDEVFRIFELLCFGRDLPQDWNSDIFCVVGASHLIMKKDR